MKRSLALLLLLFLCGACATDEGQRAQGPPSAPPTTAELRGLREALSPLPPMEGERFVSFVARARAALTAADDPALQRLASELPDDVSLLLGARRGPLGAVLVGVWARSRSSQARQEALLSLLRHATVNPPDVAVAGRSAAFDAFEADLKARAEALGLAFDHVDHVAYEVGPKAAPGASARHAVGVLVHADVVPADEPGWEVEPFAGVRKDGALWGRGALDDKGPLVAALFAVAALKDSGVPMPRRPLLIAGTSEETRWQGIGRYQEERGLPSALFVADGAFPVGVGEKGIATVRATAPAPSAELAGAGVRLAALFGGSVPNQVPAAATARLRHIDAGAAKALKARLEAGAKERAGADVVVALEGNDVVVTAAGRAAHGSTPEEGHNAVSDLVGLLAAFGGLEATPCARLLAATDQLVGQGASPRGLGVSDEHPRFSPATVNVGTVRMDPEGACTVGFDLRWPPPRGATEVVAAVQGALRTALGPDVPLEVTGGGLDPFLVAEDSALIRSLVESYEVVTGEAGAPVTLSGTTYAKAAPGSVTFGPGKAGQQGRIHAANERITLEELDELTELYAAALARLTQGG
jgi:succinyl-diaminopimelate desuccinylase